MKILFYTKQSKERPKKKYTEKYEKRKNESYFGGGWENCSLKKISQYLLR